MIADHNISNPLRGVGDFHVGGCRFRGEHVWCGAYGVASLRRDWTEFTCVVSQPDGGSAIEHMFTHGSDLSLESRDAPTLTASLKCGVYVRNASSMGCLAAPPARLPPCLCRAFPPTPRALPDVPHDSELLLIDM